MPDQGALSRALVHHRAGRLAQAAAAYRAILVSDPGAVEALRLLGVIDLDQGRLDDAQHRLSEALALAPDNCLLRQDLSRLHAASGHWPAAVFEARAAVALDATHPGAHYRLGISLNALHGASAALVPLQQAVRLEPRFHDAQYALGTCYAMLGDVRRAIGHLQLAVERAPQSAPCWHRLGLVLCRADKLLEAKQALERSVALDPVLAAAWLDLALVLESARDYGQAVSCAGTALRLDAKLPHARCQLGRLLVKAGRIGEAKHVYRTAVESGDADACVSLGAQLLFDGDTHAATALFRRALEIEPGKAAAYHNIGLGKRFRSRDDPDLTAVEALLEGDDLHDPDRAALEMTLAKAYDDMDEVDEAFVHACRGNAIRKRLLPYDRAEMATTVERLSEVFSAAYFARAGETGGVDDPLPVLIVGMPRAGSTLVEQIIASHPLAGGGGEMKTLSDLCWRIPSMVRPPIGLPEALVRLERETVHRLAEEYLAHMRVLCPGASRVTDKMPHNFTRLGLVAALLPRARVIHCRRDPLDVCVSCFLSDFSEGLAFTHDIGDLAHYYGQYCRLMAHWKAVLPLPVLEVGYEALVRNQEAVSREIIAFCGLPWDDACLKFYRTSRRIDTTSNLQVRQPIYASSIGRWRRYERHLGDLAQRLGRVGNSRAGAGR